MNIRQATDADVPAIKSLVYEVLAEYALSPDPDITDRDLSTIQQSYIHDQGYFGVVEEAGEIVATVGILRIDERTCELRKMYARSASRGKGLGKQLMEFALATARELGYQRMVLETASVLQDAIGLYRKYGFKEYYPDHLSPRCDRAFQRSL